MQKVKEPDPKPKRPAHLIDGERTEPKSCTLVLVSKPLQIINAHSFENQNQAEVHRNDGMHSC